jgi:hypothetical protein
MSNYPYDYDDDTTLPPVNDNLDDIGGQAINDLRDAVFSIEQALGLNIAGTTPNLAARLGVFILPNGNPNPSTLTALGLVTLPITNSQIIAAAGIPESKLTLDYPTIDLFNYIRDLSNNVNQAINWINVSGGKLEPHLIGAIFRHDMAQIDVAEISSQFLNNVFRTLRDNTSAYSLAVDMNNELLAHQWADGSVISGINNIITNDGGTYPSNYGHTASGIYLNSSRFAVIPQTTQDVQAFADFVDTSSILLLGTRIQNLYANGISRNSRSSSLPVDGYGQALVPVTPCIAYLEGQNGTAGMPVDDINYGDDMIQFQPSAGVLASNVFDEQFALVRVGDIITVNYSGDGYNVALPFVISEIKTNVSGLNKTYFIRIAGKNIAFAPHATAQITKCLFNNNKYGVLATAGVNCPFSSPVSTPSLIISTPRGAQCLGVGFSPDQFNETHYLLYLVLYPDGNPIDGQNTLVAIDVTGNQGTTPGAYTLSSVVAAANNAFRQPGYNYRFIAFENEGEFGIMLADSYNNASFSIINAIVTAAGTFDQTNTQLTYPNNVVDVFPVTGSQAPDPLGFGPFGAGVASPPFQNGYPTTAQALFPTYIFPPLRRNNYYVNGVEREVMNLDVDQILDQYGDGYWPATIQSFFNTPGPPGLTSVTYAIPLDLSTSGLKVGKTLVVQPYGTNFGLVNYGRYIIQGVSFVGCPVTETLVTVYDAVHAIGGSPAPIAAPGSPVGIYFDSTSVSFDLESSTDFSSTPGPFKRFFEAYINGNGETFTHERGRISISGTITVNGIPLYNTYAPGLGQLDLVNISPNLRGYQFGPVNKITLFVNNFSSSTGLYDGYLCSFDGTNFTRSGKDVTSKIGQVARFYDETNNDFVEVIFVVSDSITTFSNQYIDIQLFPTLSLDEEIMLLSHCQVTIVGGLPTVDQISDQRQFGNISEEELTTSAINFISLSDQLLHFNGVVRGFDIVGNTPYSTSYLLSLTGGMALVDGGLLSLNNEIFTIPPLVEVFESVTYPINYALCVNSDGDLVTIVLSNYDPVLGTPNAPNRVVTVENVVSTTSYQIDSNTLSEILNSRKDLTVLYIVSAVVTGVGLTATTAVTTRDARRFITDSDSCIPVVLATPNTQGMSAQGNFQTLQAAATWLKFNSAYQNTLGIKGTFSEAVDPGLTFPVNVVGQGTPAIVTFSAALTMSQANFTDVGITFAAPLTATNVSFTNCTLLFSSTTASILTNATFTNCVVTILDGYGTQISNFTAVGTTFNVGAVQAFTITGSGISFDDCIFNYVANPVGNLYVPTYNTFSLANAGSGMIYYNDSSIGGSFPILDDINITNCVFNSGIADRYSFVSIQQTIFGSIVQNVNISDNEFVSNTNVGDPRSVVTFTSTLKSGSPGFPFYPRLINVSVDDNDCNKDQMILLSVYRNIGAPIGGALLETVNCSISGNTCGVIGYITAGGFPSHQGNSTLTAAGIPGNRDKKPSLLIEENVCKLITNLDFNGYYIPFLATSPSIGNVTTSYVPVPTGPCSISRNSTNWIQVGCSSGLIDPMFAPVPAYNFDGVIISENRLSPNDPAFLPTYTDPVVGVPVYNAGITLRRDFNASGTVQAGVTQSIISNNVIQQNPVWDVPFTANFFYYNNAVLVFNNAEIYGNVVNGVCNSPSIANPDLGDFPIVFLWTDTAAPLISFHDNTLIRNDLAVSAYVSTNNVTGALSGSIVDNTFDSQYVDVNNVVFNDAFVAIPDTWSYVRNVNQIMHAAVPIYQYAATGGFGTPVPLGGGEIVGGGVAGGIDVSGGGGLETIFSTKITPSFFTLQLDGRISDMIPQGVQLLYVAVGIWNNTMGGLSGNITTRAGSYISLTINPNMSNKIAGPILPTQPATIFTAPLLHNSILDVASIVGTSTTQYAPGSGNLSLDTSAPGPANAVAIQNETIFLIADMNGFGQTVSTGKEYETVIAITFNNVAWANTATLINMSPLVLRYTWT